jgi:hypothetical protein
MVDSVKLLSSLRVIFPEWSAKIMAWMTMLLCAVGVALLGRSTPKSVSVKTSSANPVGCIKLWLSSMDPRSVSLGRVSSTSSRLPSHYLTASQSCQALGLVDTLTAPTPTMS